MAAKTRFIEMEEPKWQISHFKVEYVIERALNEVWPAFVDIREWITDYRIEAIEWPLNDPMTVGALSKVTPLTGAALNNLEEMYYLMDVYEVIPEKEIVLWLTVEHPRAFDLADVSAFYHWKLHETGGKTVITIEHFNSEKPLHASRESLRKGNPQDPESYHQYRWESWINNLKTLERSIYRKQAAGDQKCRT